jgi:exopolysaccharide biosynthesis polyprenyl glycosylphosphotransferase
MKKRSELIFSLILVPIDYFMMILGFVAAYFYRLGSDKPLAYDIGGTAYLRYLIILLPLWVLIFAMLGLYSLGSTRRRIDEIVKVFIASACGVMALIVLDFFNPQPLFPSKSIVIYGFIATFVLVALARLILSVVQRVLFHYGVGVHQTLILAPNKLVTSLERDLGPGYHVLNGLLKDFKPRSATPEDIERIHAQRHIDEIIHMHANSVDDARWLGFCQQNNIAYRYIPSIMGLYGTNVQTSLHGGVPVLELRATPLEGWGRIVKRIVDFITSLFGIIFLSPLFVVIAAAIKLTDPGSVFYAHERLSKSGKKIRVLKFRSMKMEYSTGGKYASKTAEEALAKFGDPGLLEEFKKFQKVKNDPRISKVGAFLRKTSLDELPQLFNIFKGDLSLVGPRPIVESELERYGALGGKFLAIKPGLTGLWQVSGRNDIGYDERVELDIYYVENWSLWMDLTILLRTLGVVVRGRGY